MSDRVCLVSGVGPGTGSALVRRFAEGGYRVAMLARTESRLQELAEKVPGATAFPCDVADEAQVAATTARISRELGPVNVLVHGDFTTVAEAAGAGARRISVGGALARAMMASTTSPFASA